MPKGKPRDGLTRDRSGLKLQYPAEYVTWQTMLRRCEGGNSGHGANYVKRGITVCPRWKESYLNFVTDIGRRPSGPPRAWSLERLNNNGGYGPNNCIWATPKQQATNRTQRASRPEGVLAFQLREAGASYSDICVTTGLSLDSAMSAVYYHRKKMKR